MCRSAVIICFIFFIFLSKAQKIDGLVAKYSFDKGNANDDLGKHNAKAYGAKLTEDRFGNENSAYYLQGNPDSYISLGSSPDIKPVRGSIAIWVKINQPIYKGSGVKHNPIIWTRAQEGEDFNEAFYIGYHLELENINVNTTYSELDLVTLYPTKTTSLREWHHVVITYDNKFLCFYLDGILENKAAKDFENTFLEKDSVLVGRITGKKNNRYLNGCIDNIEIYNRVLTPDEVDRLYLAPNPNKNAILLKWTMIILILIILLLIIVWLIKRRISKLVNIEKGKNQLKNNWYEQENKVLTAQMNPHFIFNSLNTIQQFIIINDNEKAQLYLSKFSRLLRMILESNVKDRISLKEEIEIVQQYLEIESLRFNNVFKYKIVTDAKMDLQNIHIPRFLIQPFVENAIWHGLLPKNGDKQLEILFEIINEKSLSCIIEDNGVGRKVAQKKAPEEKNKSLAINFIEQRLQLMSKIYKIDYGITIIDKTDISGVSTGTRIIATIPVLNN